MDVLKVKNLTKKFGSPAGGFKAVDNISFSLREGEILGLLGPNGAGKTTTIQMLLGITTPTAGTIQYFGKDFFKNIQYCLQRINYASAFNTLQGRNTVRENLLVFSYLYQVNNPAKKISELISYFGAGDLLNTRYWDLSTGQRTRINFIKSLLNDPQIILMDEPTASLDPDVADKTLSLIEKLKKDKKISLLYTSHNMTEITRICDRVVFLERGKIVAHDTPLELMRKIETTKIVLTYNTDKATVIEYINENKLIHTFLNDNKVVVETTEKLIPKIIYGISKKGVWVTDIEVQKPTLQNVFLQIARGKSHVFKKN